MKGAIKDIDIEQVVYPHSFGKIMNYMAQVEQMSLASVHVQDRSIDVPGVEKLNEMSNGSNSVSNSVLTPTRTRLRTRQFGIPYKVCSDDFLLEATKGVL